MARLQPFGPLKPGPEGPDPFKGCLQPARAPGEGRSSGDEHDGLMEALVAAKGSDLHFIALYRDGLIELEDALSVATNPTTSRSPSGARAWSPDQFAYSILSGH